ncbi:hypothetical protein E3N88_02211 [Mikania micrantha]|uniref:Reverse transcriptase domain-containing protein n=1 Tax=Mikania micrantha TaxID=192012 RepID=A0A5N6Q361_9ASTR|nr:hypothetical protein E3N88_02211 [Mikania micrantha]
MYNNVVPIILGRPFLRTAKAIIDVYEGKLTFRVGDESVCLKIAKSMSVGGELVHQVDGVILVSDELGVNEVMGGGPWDVGDRGPDLIAGEEVFNQFDAIKMNWSHQQKIKKTSYRLEENRPKNNEIKILNSGTLRVSRRTSETLSRNSRFIDFETAEARAFDFGRSETTKEATGRKDSRLESSWTIGKP